MKPISPELVLVDDALGLSARAALPDTPSVPASSARMSTPRGPTRGEVARGQRRLADVEALAPGRRLQPWKEPVILLAVGVLCLPLAGSRIGAPEGTQSPRAAPAADTSAAVTHPARRTAVKRAAEKGPRAIKLRWRPVRGAPFYNIILWRNGARALDLWPRKAQIGLPAKSLAPGEYRWFVYPAAVTKRGVRYGRLVEQGTLTL